MPIASISTWSRLLATASMASLLAATTAEAQTQSFSWRLVVFDPDPARVQQVVQAVEQALGEYGRVAKNVGLLPTPLPPVPGQVGFRNVQVGPYLQRSLNCDEAYARIENTGGAGNALGTVSENYAACVFPSKAGTRASFVFKRSIGGDGFKGFITGTIAKAVQGSDQERAQRIVNDALSILRRTLPELWVELIEVPGVAPEQPDGAKVDERLAAAAPKPAEAVSATVAPAAVAAPAPAAAGVAAAIEARKQLTAMGLIYHAVDALHEAIRRRDAIAVQLFIDAAAVDFKAAGRDGLDAAAVAQATGDGALVAMVEKAARR